MHIGQMCFSMDVSVATGTCRTQRIVRKSNAVGAAKGEGLLCAIIVTSPSANPA